MKIEIEREDDGRWIAEVPDLPGVMVYGRTRDEALHSVEALALCVVAERVAHGDLAAGGVEPQEGRCLETALPREGA